MRQESLGVCMFVNLQLYLRGPEPIRKLREILSEENVDPGGAV